MQSEAHDDGKWRRRFRLPGWALVRWQISSSIAPLRQDPNVHPHRQEDKSDLPRIHGQERHVPLRAGDRLRHQDGWRHVARQRWHDASRSACVQYGGGSKGTNGLRRERHLRSSGRGGGRDLRIDHGRTPSHRVHHRRHSCARHGEGQACAIGREIAADRAELSRRDDRRRMQDRNHARQHFQSWQRRYCVALGHAHL